jgi:hypothetical protein
MFETSAFYRFCSIDDVLVGLRVETLETAKPQNINTPHRKKEKVEGEERK